MAWIGVSDQLASSNCELNDILLLVASGMIARGETSMPEFRLTQISDTHLARRLNLLTDNFNRLAEHIDASRPDLVVNSGDVAFDGPNAPDDLQFARTLHDALPVACRYLPGNHDIGDNPTQVGPAPSEPVNEKSRLAFISAFGEDHWRFDAAGWCFIGLNSLVMNSGLVSEAEHADVRLVASGHVHQRRDFTHRGMRHVWAPSAGFIISDARQERIGVKEVGLVEYRFQPDAFEVRHVRAPAQRDVDLDELLVPAAG
jgi:predicted phosphodiesterase